MSNTLLTPGPPVARLRTVSGLPWYYLAATTARVGDEMVGVAVVLLVLDRTGSPGLAGAVVAAYTLPTVLSGPVLGAWLDRTRYRRAALAGNQVMLAAVMLALLATVGTAPGWTAVALAPLVGVLVPMTSGGFTSLLPRFVPAELLGRAHAVEGGSFHSSAILGPAAAATVAATVSPGAAVLTIVGFAAISVAALTGVPVRVGAARPDGAGPAGPGTAPGVRPPGLAATVRTGLAHLARTPPLRSATLATSTAFVGVGMLTIALPVRAGELAGDPALGGYVWTAIELGALVTALTWGRWHARWRPERVVLAAVAGYGLVLLGWPLAGVFPALLALAVLAGLVTGAGLPALFSTRQRYTPAAMYGQISTTGASLKLGGFAVGAAAGGQLVPALGPATVLAVVAATHLLAATLGALAGRSRHRSGPGPAAATTVRAPQPRTAGWCRPSSQA